MTPCRHNPTTHPPPVRHTASSYLRYVLWELLLPTSQALNGSDMPDTFQMSIAGLETPVASTPQAFVLTCSHLHDTVEVFRTPFIGLQSSQGSLDTRIKVRKCLIGELPLI